MGELILQEDGHIYRHPVDTIPGITLAIQEADLSGPLPDQWYLDRGKALHRACEYLDLGRLILESLDDEIKPRVEAYQLFKEREKFIPRWIEYMAHSHIYLFACTLDREGAMNGVEGVIIELKAGPSEPWHGIQTAGQDLCLPVHQNGPRRRYGLELRANGTYHLTRYMDRSDYTMAKAVISTYHWKEKNGRLQHEPRTVNY